jgi:vesicular inhibitory amino acid transporter
MIALFLCAVVTSYTAKLLGKCMDLDPSLITFSDIAYLSYGRKARIATSVLFTLELIAANVALGSSSLPLFAPREKKKRKGKKERKKERKTTYRCQVTQS